MPEWYHAARASEIHYSDGEYLPEKKNVRAAGPGAPERPFVVGEVIESRMLAAGPVSRIRRSAFQTDNLFEISRREASMMSTWAVAAGFASHRRHKFADFID